MDKFVIEGGVRLEGEIPVSGAKNSALPAMAACLLTSDPVVLHRIPEVRDIRTMARLLEHIGAQVEFSDGTLKVIAAELRAPEAPYELVKTMRASSLVLGPLVARCGRAKVSLPGDAPSEPGLSTCTSRGCNGSAPASGRNTAISSPKPPTACVVP
jgi:UDP-N-acetylglucosamine 1-carboxyvinyltransferase